MDLATQLAKSHEAPPDDGDLRTKLVFALNGDQAICDEVRNRATRMTRMTVAHLTERAPQELAAQLTTKVMADLRILVAEESSSGPDSPDGTWPASVSNTH